MADYKNISIPEDCHERLREDAHSFNDMKLQAMVLAYQRGWHLLTAEQQMQAIRCVPESPLAGLGEQTATDAQGESISMGCDVANLNVVVRNALRDGQLTKGEAKTIRSFLRRVQRRVESTARLVETAAG